MRFIGNTLKSFILRVLLFWPHVLRGLRHIWSLLSGKTGTNPKDVLKKKGDQARASFPRASGVCEGYSTIHASQHFNRASEPHFEPNNAEVLHLGPIVGQSQSTPHSPASSLAPSLPSSDRYIPVSSTSSIANADNIQLPPIPHLNTPLTLTHSRATSTQFAGAPHRSRSRSPFPLSHSLPQSSTLESPAASPDHSRSPSPLLFSQPLPLPQPNVLDSSGSTQIPDVTVPHGSSERYRRPAIKISPPSRTQTTEDDSQRVINFPQSPLSFQQGHLSQFPTASAENTTPEPSDPGSLGLVQENACHSSESLRLNTLAPSPNRASHPFPLPYNSQVTLVDIPIVDALGNWSDGKRRSIGLMHSDQVSRYVNKGDV